MALTGNQHFFLKLLQSGLWEKDVFLEKRTPIDFHEVYQLAEEQSVVGLLTAGLDHVKDVKVPQYVTLQFVGSSLQQEQRNLAMNVFVAELIDYLRSRDVYTLLVKGQGIAQCYERQLWRACGDVDLLLSDSNYTTAELLLTPLAKRVDEEYAYNKHIAMNIKDWEVELHGTLRCGLWKSLDCVIDEVQNEVFHDGLVRSWLNGKTQVFLPRADEDVVFVFTHILKHFFKEGVGLRQICDWCRLLWTYRESLNHGLLKSRIIKAGVMSEWKAFAALAVDALGMPKEAMPFYSSDKKWKKKADQILSFILETGNMGHSRDWSYFGKYPYVMRKAISLWRHTCDGIMYFRIFPLDALKVWNSMVASGISFALRGKY